MPPVLAVMNSQFHYRESRKPGLRKICSKILAAARKPARYDNQMITGQISIGAHICHEKPGSNELLRAADIALYNAKNSGKNRFVLFNESMADQLKTRRDLERRLQVAHERREFELNYQPIIDRRTLKIAGFEALLRLPDGNGGLHFSGRIHSRC